jgi:hypothetical protein
MKGNGERAIEGILDIRNILLITRQISLLIISLDLLKQLDLERLADGRKLKRKAGSWRLKIGRNHLSCPAIVLDEGVSHV